jgi:hypothetical protein
VTFHHLEWIIPVLAVIGFILGFLITIKQQKITGIKEVIDTITTKYLDERKFKFAELSKDMKLPDEVTKQALRELERRDVLYRSKEGYYSLNDPLVFLSEKDMIRAERLTKGDNLIYGAYQHPFFSHKELIVVYFIFIFTLIFGAVCIAVPAAYDWIKGLLPGTPGLADVAIFLLFLILIGMVTTDSMENLISIWSRERFSVIIGEYSGISYDTSYSDEFSGRIGRGVIRRVDLTMTPLQKFMNYFMRVPIGDIIINSGKAQDLPQGQEPTPKKTKTGKEPAPKKESPGIIFKNMPFPREMFYVLRSIQLKSLGWRKRHARTLMLWRAKGAIPSVGF